MLKSQMTINVMALLTLALFWSSSFPAIKIAVEISGPISLVAVRGCVGFVVVLALVQLAGKLEWRPYLRYVPYIFVMSIVGMSLPFYLISRAELVLESSLTGLLMSVGPLLTILGAHFFLQNERMTTASVVGVLTGFAGVALLLGKGATTASYATIEAQISVMFATGCYVVGNLMARRIAEVPPLFMSLAMLIFLVVQMMPLALWLERPDFASWPADVWGAAVWLGLFSTGLAFSLRYYLIRHAGAGFTAYVGYLIPMFSVILGALILNETLSSEKLIAVALIIAGLGISQNWMRRNKSIVNE